MTALRDWLRKILDLQKNILVSWTKAAAIDSQKLQAIIYKTSTNKPGGNVKSTGSKNKHMK